MRAFRSGPRRGRRRSRRCRGCCPGQCCRGRAGAGQRHGRGGPARRQGRRHAAHAVSGPWRHGGSSSSTRGLPAWHQQLSNGGMVHVWGCATASCSCFSHVRPATGKRPTVHRVHTNRPYSAQSTRHLPAAAKGPAGARQALRLEGAGGLLQQAAVQRALLVSQRRQVRLRVCGVRRVYMRPLSACTQTSDNGAYGGRVARTMDFSRGRAGASSKFLRTHVGPSTAAAAGQLTSVVCK